jgi:hypothetical protein
MQTIHIARDFSPYPAGRYGTDGKFSGERFRDELLIPALKANDKVRVVLDDTRGYGSSFLEEVFGGLIRADYTLDNLKNQLEIVAEGTVFKRYKTLAERHIEAAAESNVAA